MPSIYTYTTVATVPWSPDFVNLSVCDQTGLVGSADFAGNYGPLDAISFANVPEHFEEGSTITNTSTGIKITNVGTVAVPNFVELTDQAGDLSSTLASGKIFVGNASNIATGVAMSGDAIIDNAGVVTVTGMNGVTEFISVVNLSSSDILQLNSFPINGLVALDPTKTFVVDEIIWMTTFKTAAYTGANNVEFKYAGTGAKVCADVPFAVLNIAGGTQEYICRPTSVAFDGNSDITISVPTADPAAGSGSATVTFKYRLLS